MLHLVQLEICNIKYCIIEPYDWFLIEEFADYVVLYLTYMQPSESLQFLMQYKTT